jgi:hypothetical protein
VIPEARRSESDDALVWMDMENAFRDCPRVFVVDDEEDIAKMNPLLQGEHLRVGVSDYGRMSING